METFPNIIKIHCPIIYFHRNEKYFPCSKKEFMLASSYHDKDGKKLLSKEELTADISKLVEKITLNRNDNYLKIEDRKIWEKGENPELYCIFSDPFVFNNKNYFYLTYYMVFGYNGTLAPHEMDIEYCTMLFECGEFFDDGKNFSASNSKPIYVYLSSHGHGNWFGLNHFDKQNERIIIYSALESHAIYPKVKVYKRVFGFGDDVTDNGVLYDFQEKTVPLANVTSKLINYYFEEEKLNYFNGRFHNQHSTLYRENMWNPLLYNGQYKLQGGISGLKDKVKDHLLKIKVAMWLMFILSIAIPHSVDYFELASYWNHLAFITNFLFSFVYVWLYLA